jgi:hypothetical protein
MHKNRTPGGNISKPVAEFCRTYPNVKKFSRSKTLTPTDELNVA